MLERNKTTKDLFADLIGSLVTTTQTVTFAYETMRNSSFPRFARAIVTFVHFAAFPRREMFCSYVEDMLSLNR